MLVGLLLIQSNLPVPRIELSSYIELEPNGNASVLAPVLAVRARRSMEPRGRNFPQPKVRMMESSDVFVFRWRVLRSRELGIQEDTAFLTKLEGLFGGAIWG